jgi:DNA-binding response OmpR family regulator
MPLLSGLDTHSRLRATHPSVPVIYITASDDPTLDAIVLEAHGLALLRKPFPTDRLLSAVASALKERS